MLTISAEKKPSVKAGGGEAKQPEPQKKQPPKNQKMKKNQNIKKNARTSYAALKALNQRLPSQKNIQTPMLIQLAVLVPES